MSEPPEDPAATAAELRRVGLCARCRHARRVVSAKGSVFFMCQLAARDPRFSKYPRLPVLSCPGHESGTPNGG